MSQKTRLSVNVNKIATLRNARGENVPDLVKVALDCEKFGAQGITVHPRPDERHIKKSDVPALARVLTTEFNIEGFPDDNFLKLVEQVKPAQVTLVPDAPQAVTSNSGWDVIGNRIFLRDVISRLHESGIRVSIFVAPEKGEIEESAIIGADRVELYTKPYAENYGASPEEAIMPYVTASQAAHEAGLGVNAGHDLSLVNLSYFNGHMPWLDEVSIGHALISDALYLGLKETIRLYLEALCNKN